MKQIFCKDAFLTWLSCIDLSENAESHAKMENHLVIKC